MLRLGSELSRAFVVVGLGLLALQGSARSQVDAHGKHGPASRAVPADGPIDAPASPESGRTVFVGRVVGPDGAPAVGAVVVTSAGGQAVTDAEGAFSLEVEVPVGAESVRVTAVMGAGTGSLFGSVQVGVLAPWGTTAAGTLILDQSDGCQPNWLPTFGNASGVNSSIAALTVFDDGSGSALYAGGECTIAGGVSANGIAKWNGSSWSALGSGTIGSVSALTVFDDGSGPALYAGGAFTIAGGVAANYIAKWDGSTWSALGSGMNNTVYALTALDDGSGPALYAGGGFSIAGGVAASTVARWNGSSWSNLGSGLANAVNALTVFDAGIGPDLHAGGVFAGLGVVPTDIARWNGTKWSALGSGVAFGVYALTVFDDGSGSALYAGGGFTTAGGMAANHIAKWNGTSWSALGSGMNGTVEALTVFDDGSGPALYVGGSFTSAIDSLDSYLAKWGGCSVPPSPWTSLGSGLAGVSGIPELTGVGDLVAGTPGSLSLVEAAPSALAALFISTSNTPTPFKGGTLLTVPVLLTLLLPTDSQGDFLLPWTAWPPGLSGLSLYFQAGIQDAAAVKGVALSTALRADVP